MGSVWISGEGESSYSRMKTVVEVRCVGSAAMDQHDEGPGTPQFMLAFLEDATCFDSFFLELYDAPLCVRHICKCV